MSDLLDRDFFDRPVEEVAPSLLGQIVVHHTGDGEVAIRLTEVEAYAGPMDPASHSYRGRTPRNAVMWGPPGHVYVYFTYGMHFCMNLVCGPDGTASAVLLRAGEVIDGRDLAAARRPRSSFRDLARGPARLCQALGVAREHNGLDACDADSPLRVLAGDPVDPSRVRTGPRVGVSAAKETPWRFWIDGEPSVSQYRMHVPRRRRTTGTG
ncbi:DNA-3-methyladenine glycosylase [Thermomonospora curvata]|uniref:Putative 3-methyladenine DNA glycosylase n=1 Tax=Thermomonospora curvata (strain ATCC 19995 / DSM 43183 / JCM 3096 / KCTC 9072 / NBRC 15933 / NCIMB 10081 / Henssen B9) TaxID=471852 RepID=D1A1N7_THECD|nr:DNA-3-methyladenine glycosylase [Thermomonospora curvata]ACY97725.1 DNA-3-methyladenine glycosylase [Thermomonospora curvata DSM 43183]